MLQQSTSYLVGTTNSIFQQQRDCQIDVLVNVRRRLENGCRRRGAHLRAQIDTATLDFVDPKLASICNMTAADRKWMDEVRTVALVWPDGQFDRRAQLVATVNDSWNAADPARPLGMKCAGDALRMP